MNSFIASCAPSPASGASFSGGGEFALAMVCVAPGDAVDIKRVCLARAREDELKVSPSRLILEPAAAWARRGVCSRLRSSLELAEEKNMLKLVYWDGCRYYLPVGGLDSSIHLPPSTSESCFFWLGSWICLDFGFSGFAFFGF